MNLQHARVAGQSAGKENATFADFLEWLLTTETAARGERKRQMLRKRSHPESVKTWGARLGVREALRWYERQDVTLGG